MPLTLLFGAMGVFVTYWTDKFTFLRLVRTPPGYDEKIARATGSLLPYAVVLHCFFGLWMYSNQNIFQLDMNVEFVDPESPGVMDEIPEHWSTKPGDVFNRVSRVPVVVMLAFVLFLIAFAFVRYFLLRRI